MLAPEKHVTLDPAVDHDNVPNERYCSWSTVGHLRVSPRTNKYNKIRSSQDVRQYIEIPRA